MELEAFKQRLKKYGEGDIVVTNHARLQAEIREIGLEEVRRNVLSPERLVYCKKGQALGAGEEKYECYFAYSNTCCHKYIIVINAKAIIVTVIKINRKWQRRFEKYGRM